MNAIKEKPCTTDDVLNFLEIISLQQNTIKDQEKKLESGTKKLESFTKFWSAHRQSICTSWCFIKNIQLLIIWS